MKNANFAVQFIVMTVKPLKKSRFDNGRLRPKLFNKFFYNVRNR